MEPSVFMLKVESAARIARVMLIVNLVMSAIVLVSQIGFILEFSLNPMEYIPYFNQLSRWAYWIMILAFLVWVYLATRQVKLLGVVGFTTTPVWGVVGFIIPIVNFFMPIKSMRELWKASHPEGGENWETLKAPSSIPVWWILFLVNLLLPTLFVFIISETYFLDELRFIAIYNLIKSTVYITFLGLTMQMINQITEMQRSKVSNLKGTGQAGNEAYF